MDQFDRNARSNAPARSFSPFVRRASSALVLLAFCRHLALSCGPSEGPALAASQREKDPDRASRNSIAHLSLAHLPLVHSSSDRSRESPSRAAFTHVIPPSLLSLTLYTLDLRIQGRKMSHRIERSSQSLFMLQSLLVLLEDGMKTRKNEKKIVNVAAPSTTFQ